MHKSRYDQPLRKLRQVRDELREEHQRIRQELARLEKMIAQLETMNVDGEPNAASDSSPAVALASVTADDIDGLTHAQVATLILSRAPAPMTIRQLLVAFERAGRTFSAKNGYGILHKSLRSHRQFDSVAGRWRLVMRSETAPNLKLA